MTLRAQRVLVVVGMNPYTASIAKTLAAKYMNRSDFSLGECTIDSLSTSLGIPLGQLLSIVIDRLLLEEIDLRTKLEIYVQIEREFEVTK